MIKYLTEFIGTFIFLSVILVAANSNIKWAAFPIGLALTIAVFFGGNISGGHFNPAVSLMFLLDNKLKMMDFIGYVVSQILGGVLALMFYKMAGKFYK